MSIRGLAMGKEGTEKKQPKPTYPTYSPKPYTPPSYSGGWGGEFLPPVRSQEELFPEDKEYSPYKGYQEPDNDQIDILIRVKMTDMLSPTDYWAPNYDYEIAKLEAQAIAYDKLIEILGKEFESKYTTTFDVLEGLSCYEVNAFLTPVK
jgi:hypothetical protein